MYGTGYEVIFVAFSGIVLAQIVKCFLHLIVKRNLDLRLFTTTGGMPSSHSAGVMGLSTAVGLIRVKRILQSVHSRHSFESGYMYFVFGG